VSKRDKKEEAGDRVGVSTWKLKSPAIKISDGEEMRSSSKVENSDKNCGTELEGGL
jgi:hypothetical protein